MSWNDGPLQSWYDIHEAMRHELATICSMSESVTTDDRLALQSLTDRVQFFMDILTVHSEHEDGIIFPFMRWRGLTVDDSFTTDHHRESALVHDLRVALISIRFRANGRSIDRCSPGPAPRRPRATHRGPRHPPRA